MKGSTGSPTLPVNSVGHCCSFVSMIIWIVILKVFGYIWLVLAGIVIVAGVVGIWLKEGFSGVQVLMSPFNVINWIVTVMTLAPGLGALILARRLREKQGLRK